MSLYEGAQARSSFATGTPMGIAKGLAHLAAAAAHGANAAMAPEMAEHARTASRAGISGGGGAGGATAGVQSLALIHISEPTRLPSISYAVFCLEKKKKKKKKIK